MKSLERTLLKFYTICTLWSLYAVGLARCELNQQLFDFKLVPSLHEVVHFENDSYIVSCQASNTRVRWWSPKNQVKENYSGRIHIIERANETDLVFTSIQMQDRGNWSCEAEGFGRLSFTMKVYRSITFVDTPNIQSAKEGEDALIKCMTSADPEPIVSWYYNGEPLNSKSQYIPFAIQSNKVVFFPAEIEKYAKLADGLSIKRVHMNDTGEYTCKAFQSSQTVMSLNNIKEKTIRLNVQHKPVPPVRRESADIQYGYIKGHVNVTCEAVAEPPAQFHWFRNGKQLHPKHHQIISGEHISILQLFLSNSSLYGDYVCEAKNSLGTLKRTITLLNGTKPATPAHLSLRGVNSNTFDLDVEAKRSLKPYDPMNINGYRFELISMEDFNNSGSRWTKARVVLKDFTDGVLYLINDLTPNTTYYIRVASKNAAGLSDWMGPEMFRTHAKTILGINPESPSSSSVILSFNLISLVLTYLIQHLI